MTIFNENVSLLFELFVDRKIQNSGRSGTFDDDDFRFDIFRIAHIFTFIR